MLDRAVFLTELGFCGVPGQACADEKVAAPTAQAGSHFVDVGDVQSQELEGKLADGVKRDAAVAAPVSVFRIHHSHGDD